MSTQRSAPKPRQRWTKRQILALGTRCTIAEAGSIIAGLSETQSRALYHRGDFPVPVLRVGHRLVVPTEPILRLLHLVDGGADNRSADADQRHGGDGGPPGPDPNVARPAPPGRATAAS